MINHLAHARNILIASVCLWILGCGENSPTAKPLSPDEEILLYLDYYDPIYKVDGQRRVIFMKMDGRVLTADVLAEIGKLTALQGISLYGVPISDEGLANFKDLQNLHNLGIGGTPITDKGLEHIEKLQSLRNIWIPKANVTEEAVEKLKKAVPGLKVHFQ